MPESGPFLRRRSINCSLLASLVVSLFLTVFQWQSYGQINEQAFHQKDLPVMDVFYNELKKYVANDVKARKAQLDDDLKKNRISSAEWRSQVKDLNSYIAKIKDVDTVKSLYTNLKASRDSIGKLASEWEKEAGLATFIPSEINAGQLSVSQRIGKYANASAKGLEYIQKIQSLSNDLNDIKKQGYSEENGIADFGFNHAGCNHV